MEKFRIVLFGLVLLGIIGILATVRFFSFSPRVQFTLPDNLVSVTDTLPSNRIMLNTLVLENPSFVAVYDNNNGSSGKMLGVSPLNQAGVSQNVTIKLDRETIPGEVIHLLIFTDNGDGEFTSSSEDQPVKTANGDPLSTSFTITL